MKFQARQSAGFFVRRDLDTPPDSVDHAEQAGHRLLYSLHALGDLSGLFFGYTAGIERVGGVGLVELPAGPEGVSAGLYPGSDGVEDGGVGRDVPFGVEPDRNARRRRTGGEVFVDGTGGIDDDLELVSAG